MKQSEFVANLRRDLESAKVLAQKIKLFEPELFTEQPEEGKWSAGQCFDHCAVAFDKYRTPLLSKFEELKSDPEKDFGNEEVKFSLMAKFFFTALDPKKKKRNVPAPKAFMPNSEKMGIEQVDRFLVLLEEFTGFLDVFEKHSMTRQKIKNPVIKFLTFRLSDAYQIHAWHNLRHIEQAQRAIDAIKAKKA